MDQKIVTALISIDWSKAFDSTGHEILLKKLEVIGASPSALQWFHSYLSGRVANSLLINPGKTKFLLFCTHQLLNRFSEGLSLNFLGKSLHPVFSAKDLGVTIDSYLKFDEHISKMVLSCMSKLCQINRIRNLLDHRTLSLIVQALILSKLFYCSSAWSNTAAKKRKETAIDPKFRRM